MTKRELAFAAAGLVAGGGGGALVGLPTKSVAVEAPVVAEFEAPYGSHELTDPEAAAFAVKLLDGAKPSGMTCEKAPGGPEKTLCTDGSLGRWISDAAAKALGVEYGTIAISAGPGGKAYVR